ncbi:MAG: hypothetical protein KJ578_02725 [Bacteroidetes bacterium]|nr:hypothetical protein [Bacteroidota bacterium]MBU1578412.1 hypothetical protein [Bacteroidota bacterium]MBU2556676.1 hypothetical protein [Bacteroidota bacterium]
MIAKATYKFDDQLKILFKTYHGAITIQDLTRTWDEAIEQNHIPANVKGFILDYREAGFNIPLDRYKEIPAYYRLHPEVFEGYRIAILTNSPKDIVIPVLVEMEDFGYQSRPFSTLEAAVKWVLLKEK